MTPRGRSRPAAEDLFPVEGAILQGEPGVDEDVEIALDGGGLGLEAFEGGAFLGGLLAVALGLELAGLFGDLLDVGGVVEAVEEEIDAAHEETVGGAENDAEDNAGEKSRPVAGQIGAREMGRLEKDMHGLGGSVVSYDPFDKCGSRGERTGRGGKSSRFPLPFGQGERLFNCDGRRFNFCSSPENARYGGGRVYRVAGLRPAAGAGLRGGRIG